MTRTLWPIAAMAALAGAVLATGALVALGGVGADRERRVTEKVALTPVVSSPMVDDTHSVGALARQIAPTVVLLRVQRDDGSERATGVVFRDDGMLLTSARAVADARSVSVVLHDGRSLDGQVVGLDAATDVAVLAVDARDLPVAVMGDGSDLEVGTPTVAVGSGVTGADDRPVATGVVSALDGRLDVDGGSLHGLIQTDAAIDPTWIGGPLLNADGAVIGISNGSGGEATGFGYATPINLVRRTAEQLMTTGHVVQAWLGIEARDLSHGAADGLDVPGGAEVDAVSQSSPAAAGGVQAGDVITEIDGDPVLSSSGLVVAMRDHAPGDSIRIGYYRADEHRETTVVCDQRP